MSNQIFSFPPISCDQKNAEYSTANFFPPAPSLRTSNASSVDNINLTDGSRNDGSLTPKPTQPSNPTFENIECSVNYKSQIEDLKRDLKLQSEDNLRLKAYISGISQNYNTQSNQELTKAHETIELLKVHISALERISCLQESYFKNSADVDGDLLTRWRTKVLELLVSNKLKEMEFHEKEAELQNKLRGEIERNKKTSLEFEISLQKLQIMKAENTHLQNQVHSLESKLLDALNAQHLAKKVISNVALTAKEFIDRNTALQHSVTKKLDELSGRVAFACERVAVVAELLNEKKEMDEILRMKLVSSNSTLDSLQGHEEKLKFGKFEKAAIIQHDFSLVSQIASRDLRIARTNIAELNETNRTLLKKIADFEELLESEKIENQRRLKEKDKEINTLIHENRELKDKMEDIKSYYQRLNAKHGRDMNTLIKEHNSEVAKLKEDFEGRIVSATESIEHDYLARIQKIKEEYDARMNSAAKSAENISPPRPDIKLRARTDVEKLQELQKLSLALLGGD